MTEMKTYLVFGGRDFANVRPGIPHHEQQDAVKQYAFVMEMLNKILPHHPDDEMQMPWGKIIAGGARGVDSAAIDFAVVHWLEFQEFPADWNTHKKAAGPIRNQQMLIEGNPDVGIEFPGGRGTADMSARLKKAGIPVIKVTYPEGATS